MTLDGSASTDSDGTIVGYRWDFDGDGTIDAQTTSATVSHTYAAGDWHVGLTVVDDDGTTSTPTLVEVRSSNPPTARASVPSKAKGGTPVTLDASASSDSDGTIVSYHFTFGDGTEIVSTTPVVTHVWSPARATTYGWTLVVTDDTGVRAGTQGTIKITP